MARKLNGTSEYLERTASPVSGPPFTLACWFQSNSDSATQALMSVYATGSAAQRWDLFAAGATAGDPVAASTVASLGSQAVSSTGYTVGRWHHGCAVFASATDRRAFIDGGSKGTNSTSRIPSIPNRLRIGVNSNSQWANGCVAVPGLWNVALNDEEVRLLGLGYHPRLIRPDALLFAPPLLKLTFLISGVVYAVVSVYGWIRQISD